MIKITAGKVHQVGEFDKLEDLSEAPLKYFADISQEDKNGHKTAGVGFLKNSPEEVIFHILPLVEMALKDQFSL